MIVLRHAGAAANHAAGLQSPMPFGCDCPATINTTEKKMANLPRLQCLSAVIVLRPSPNTTTTSPAPMSPMPFGCDCPATSLPWQRSRLVAQSPMPFGCDCPATYVRKYHRLRCSCLQCLSAVIVLRQPPPAPSPNSPNSLQCLSAVIVLRPNPPHLTTHDYGCLQCLSALIVLRPPSMRHHEPPGGVSNAFRL